MYKDTHTYTEIKYMYTCIARLQKLEHTKKN
jgi:hypothetical protein